MISTKGRYCLRVLADLAQHSGGEFVPMSQIAQRQAVSQKYLEKLLPVLVKNNLIEGARGKNGGYRLTKDAQQYNVWEILQLTENMAPVACLKNNARGCKRAQECVTLPMWEEYYKITKDYFSSLTLADLTKPAKV